MPVLMLLITASVQFAVYEHAVTVALDAAQRGLQAARVQGGSNAAGQTAALTDAAQLGSGILVGPAVTVTRTGGSVSVQVRGSAEPVMPGITLHVAAVAAGPLEQFSPTTGP